MSTAILLLMIGVLVLLSGFFSGSEIALVSADRLKLNADAADTYVEHLLDWHQSMRHFHRHLGHSTGLKPHRYSSIIGVFGGRSIYVDTV